MSSEYGRLVRGGGRLPWGRWQWLRWRLGSAALSIAAVGVIATSSPGASAQDAKSDAAEALFEQARDLVGSGKLAEACDKVAASNALEPGVGTLLYLGDCYERTGRFASAITTFRQAGALAREREDNERAHVAEVRSAALQPRTPKLELRVAKKAELPGLQITLNGTPIAQKSWNVPQFEDAGVYEVRVAAPGFEPFSSKIELRNGDSAVAVLPIPRLVELGRGPVQSEQGASASPAAMPEDEPSWLDQETLGLMLGGAGILLAGTTGVLAAFASSSNQDSYEFCNPDAQNQCNPEGVSLRKAAQDMATIATITGIAAAATLAGGVVLYVTAPGLESGAPEAAMLNVKGSFDWF